MAAAGRVAVRLSSDSRSLKRFAAKCVCGGLSHWAVREAKGSRCDCGDELVAGCAIEGFIKSVSDQKNCRYF